MRKRLKLLILIAVLATAALFAPQMKRTDTKVFHQHQVWPGETAAATGLAADGSLTTHLPLIILHTDGQTIPGTQRSDTADLPCRYSVIHHPNGVNSSDDVPTQQGQALIAIRGNSSRSLPKKQYSLKLVDAAGLPEDVSLLGMPAESIWVLNGSYIDHSMIRNYMIYNIAGEIMDYAPRTRLCEVMLTGTDGKPIYQGVYTLIEKPKVSDQRLVLPEYDPTYAETSFMLQMNAHIDLDSMTYQDLNQFEHLLPDNLSAHKMGLEYPDPLLITPASMEYIQQQVIQLDRVLYNSIHLQDWSDAKEQLDFNSFANYFLINEFFQNYDAGSISTYFYQNAGGKWHIGPVWDFDAAFDNYNTSLEIDELRMNAPLYFYYLSQSEDFSKLCIRRYHQLRKSYLSTDYLLDYIDSTAAYLQSAARRNSELWYSDEGLDAFQDDILDMKQFVIERGTWLDANFEQMYALAS